MPQIAEPWARIQVWICAVFLDGKWWLLFLPEQRHARGCGEGSFLKWHVELGTIRTMPDVKSVLDDGFRLWALKHMPAR